jgi:hypothetical protein
MADWLEAQLVDPDRPANLVVESQLALSDHLKLKKLGSDGTMPSCSMSDHGLVPVNCPRIASKRADASASETRNRIPWSVVVPADRMKAWKR